MVALSIDMISALVGMFAGATYGVLGYLEGHVLKGEAFSVKRFGVTALVGLGVGALTPITAPSDLPTLISIGAGSVGTIGTVALGQKVLNVLASIYQKAAPQSNPPQISAPAVPA